MVYDKSIIPFLVQVLYQFLSGTFGSWPVAYIASTVRNEDTRDHFLVALGKNFEDYDTYLWKEITAKIFVYPFTISFQFHVYFLQAIKGFGMKYWIHPLKKSFIMMTSFQLKYWEYGTLVIRHSKIDMFLCMCSNIQKYFLYKNLTCFIVDKL